MPSFPIRFLLPALLLGVLAAAPAYAAWSNTGDLVAGNAGNDAIGYNFDSPNTAVAPDGHGGVFVVYGTSNGDSLHVNRIDGATQARLWGANGVKVNQGGNAQLTPQLLADGAGGVWVLWEDTRGATTGEYVQHFDANGTALGTAGGVLALGVLSTGLPGSPVMALAQSSDRVLVAARYTASQGVRVQRVRIPVGGSPTLEFATPVRVSTDAVSGSDSPLQLFSDGLGGGYVVWPAGTTPLPGIAGFARISANRFSAAGALQWGTNGVVVQAAAAATPDDMRAFLNGSSLFVVWHHTTATTSSIHGQMLNASGVVQWGPDTTGSVVATQPHTGFDNYTGVSAQPRLTTDTSGNLWVAWIDARDYSRPAPNGINHFQDVYVQRMTTTGKQILAASGVPVDTLAGSLQNLRVAPSDVNGLFVAYRSFLFDSGDLYLTRINSGGARSWDDFLNKTNLSLNDNIQDSAVLAPDGFGGVFVAWDDGRLAGNTDVYVTHRTSAGTTAGPTLTVVAPNGGETLQPFRTTTLSWTSTQLAANEAVRLEYAIAGQPRVTIAASTPNDGSFAWTVPDLRSTQVKVFVSDSLASSVADSSNAVFSVCSTLALADSTASISLPNDVRLTDLNRDGLPDAVVPSATGVTVLLGLGGGTFGAPATVALGTNGRNVAVEDFDEDGILDLAVTTASGVAVLRGQGSAGTWNGAFGAATVYPAASGARDLVAADFDEDGILDLAVLNGTSNSVSILRGNGANGVGNASFAAPANFAVGASPSRMVVGDFNEDGILDLANTNATTTTPSVTVLLGTGSSGIGTGTFAPAVAYAVAAVPIGITTADFNHDGIADLAVASSSVSSGVSVLLGNGSGGVGSGTFGAGTTYPFGGSAIDVKAADVDGDGITDLLAASNSLNAFVVLHGDGATFGDGTFTAGTPAYIGRAPLMLALGDLDGDGSVDAVCANTTSADLGIARGGCGAQPGAAIVVGSPNGGEFLVTGAQRTISIRRSPNVTLVDVEASRDGGARWEAVARNVVDSTFTWPVTGPTSAQALVRLTDAQRRQVRDVSDALFVISNSAVLVTHPDGGETLTAFAPDTIRWRSSTGGNVKLEYTVDGGVPQTIVAGTANDGEFAWSPPDTQTAALRVTVTSTTDPLATDTSDAGSSICERFDPASSLPASCCPRGLVTGDFNGDGILDVAGASSPGAEVWLGQGSAGVGNGTFGPSASYSAATTLTQLAAEDMDGDGITDLVGAASGGFTLLRGAGSAGTGNGAFLPGVMFGAGSTTNDVAVADFNEDGIPDVAAANKVPAALLVQLGDGVNGTGNGGFLAPSTLPLAAIPNRVRVADLNGDGIWDLVGATSSPGSVVVALGHGAAGHGDGTFAPAVSYAVGAFAGEPVVADFDGDGILDVALPATAGITVLPGLGSGGVGTGAFGIPVVANPFLVSANPLAVTDLNGDGLPDLVALLNSSIASEVVGFANRGGFAFADVGHAPTGLPVAASLRVTDWNEDGSPDLALGQGSASGVRLLQGDPCTSFSRFVTLSPPAPQAASAAPRGAAGASAASVWSVGDERTLTWSKSANVFGVDLAVSRDGGAHWSTIAREVPGTSFTWTVTRPQTASLLLRASDAASPAIASATTTPITVSDPTTGVADGVPAIASFSNGWPNPSRGSVRFELSLPSASVVDVQAYDVGGRRVASLARGLLAAGLHTVRWEAAPGAVAPGIYLVRARWAGFDEVRRVVRMP